MSAAPPPRIDGRLVVGGMAHDFDYARLELLQLFAGWPQVRLSVSDDFENGAAMERCAFLVTYTCNVQPTAQAAAALRAFLERGGRWFALHATNSLLAWTEDGVAATPDDTGFMALLGSQFEAHPPIGPFRVEITDPNDPITEGMDGFETVDELYLSRLWPDLHVLMHTHFSGLAPGFTAADWRDAAIRPVLYRRRIGAGEVLYCTLGHCRGHYDAPHRTPYYPHTERCSWDNPAFRAILERGAAWAIGLTPQKTETHDGR